MKKRATEKLRLGLVYRHVPEDKNESKMADGGDTKNFKTNWGPKLNWNEEKRTGLVSKMIF